MEQIVRWLESCGNTREEAIKEANILIRRTMYQCGQQVCSREFAIQVILEDIAMMFLEG